MTLQDVRTGPVNTASYVEELYAVDEIDLRCDHDQYEPVAVAGPVYYVCSGCRSQVEVAAT